MQVRTTSGSGGAGLGVIGTGLALALPEAKWIGWALVALGLLVVIFDVRIERGQVAVGSTQSLRKRLKRMWPQYLMVSSGLLFFVGLVGFLQLNVWPPSSSNGAAEAQPPSNQEAAKPHTIFKFEKHAFVETKKVKWADGTDADLFETRYYLIVGNALDTGRSVKNAKARIFFLGQEPLLAHVKETGELSTDIRHGEWVLFEVGKMVTVDGFPTGGFVTFSDEDRNHYKHLRPEHPKSFKVLLPSGKEAYGIGQSPGAEIDWPMTIALTADDAVSLSVKVILDIGGKTPVRFEEAK